MEQAVTTGIFDGPGEMRALMHSFDWAASPLGPPETWPQSLRTTVRTMLASRYAMWMGWGPDLVFLYNDTYGRVTLGKKHPWAMGRPAREVWSEIWADLEPRIRAVFLTGEATWDEGLLLFLERSGFPEKTYHTFSYSPLANDAGTTEGMLCVVTEETERVLSERQLASLRDLAAGLTRAKTEDAVLKAAEMSLARNGKDIPFSLIYTISEDRSLALLRASTGFESADSVLAPSQVDLKSEDSAWPIADILAEPSLMVIDLVRFPQALPGGPWNEPPVKAVAIPFEGRGEDEPAGVLIVGLNRYRPFAESYKGFFDLVAGQIAGGLAGTRAYEPAWIVRRSTAHLQSLLHDQGSQRIRARPVAERRSAEEAPCEAEIPKPEGARDRVRRRDPIGGTMRRRSVEISENQCRHIRR